MICIEFLKREVRVPGWHVFGFIWNHPGASCMVPGCPSYSYNEGWKSFIKLYATLFRFYFTL